MDSHIKKKSGSKFNSKLIIEIKEKCKAIQHLEKKKTESKLVQL